MRYLEDFAVGDTVDLGTIAVELDELLAFGRRFDPQTFHVDPEASKDLSFGGVIASAWHTAALSQRLLVEGLLHDVANLGGSGIDDLRTPRPVRPGDVLAGEARILEARPSGHKPDRGTLVVGVSMVNQDGDLVLGYAVSARCRRRPSAEDTAGT